MKYSALRRYLVFQAQRSFCLWRDVIMEKKLLSILLLIAVLFGCASVVRNSERFYKDRPPGRINWREYTSP